MAKHYVTFGQDHVHTLKGVTFDSTCVAVFDALDASSGRDKAFELFGIKFCFEYHESEWDESSLHFYSRGYVYLDTIKVLYLHGFGGDAKSSHTAELLRQEGFDVHTVQLLNEFRSSDDFLENIRIAQEAAALIKPDIVIGQSLGGFTALHVNGYMTLLINPCLKPSERGYAGEGFRGVDSLKGLESALQHPDREQRSQTFGVFSDSDELFNFCDFFLKNHSYLLHNSGHVLSSGIIREFISPLLRTIHSKIESISIFENSN